MAGVQDGPGKQPVWRIAGRALLAGVLGTVLASWLGSCESSSPPPPPDVTTVRVNCSLAVIFWLVVACTTKL